MTASKRDRCTERLADELAVAEKKAYSDTRGKVFWITGLSGSGKSTFAQALHARLCAMGLPTVMVDGDVVRDLLLTNSRMDREGRLQVAEFNARLCKFLCLQGLQVVCATISLFHSVQVWNRAEIPNYVEIFLNTPLDLIEKRDPKGLYARARAGTITNVVGIDIPPEWPRLPDFTFSAEGLAGSNPTAEQVEQVIASDFKLIAGR